jgi:hypothetical protein
MGQRFDEATLPRSADQLERLSANVEGLVSELRDLPDRSDASIEQAKTESTVSQDDQRNRPVAPRPRSGGSGARIGAARNRALTL